MRGKTYAPPGVHTGLRKSEWGVRGIAGAAVAAVLLGSLLVAPLPARAATVSYSLYGSLAGWGFSPPSISSPGPTLYADQGDLVDLTITGADARTHNWMLDYNGNGNWDAGEPRSADVAQSTTTYSFTATQFGTFRYQCQYHRGSMFGTFRINATGNPPPTVTISRPDGSLSWTGGSVQTIWWNMSDPTDPVTSLVVFLNYTSSAGSGAIAGPLSGLTSPASYPWTVPTITASDVRVNVTVLDPGGAKGYDENPVPVVDSTPPAVTATSPVDGATGVPPDASFTLAFSEPMNRPATEAAVELRTEGTFLLVPTTVVGWSGSTLTVRPQSPLATDTAYRLNVTTAARDASDPGNPLAAPVTVGFLTENLPPGIAISVPAGGERWTGGSTHTIRWAAQDPETPCAGLAADVSWSPSGAPPWVPIVGGASGCSGSAPWAVPAIDSETVVVRGNVSDGRGGTGTDVSGAFAIDSTPPTVASGAPAGAGVPRSANVRVTFSEPMNTTASSAPASFGVRDDASLAWVAGAISWDPSGAVLTFDPAVLLPPLSTFTVFVNASARDASDPGNVLASPFAWSFTTGAAADTEPPQILAAQAAPDPQEAGLAVNVTARVVDDVGVASVSLLVIGPDAGASNFTMRPGGGDTWYLERAYTLLGVYAYTVGAADGSGNWNSTSGQFAVRDTTPPTIAGPTALPDPAEVPASVNVSAEVRDNAGVASVAFEVAGIGNLTASFDAGSGRHFALAFATSTGTYAVTAWACDVGSNCAAAAGQFLVRDTTPPTVDAVRVLPVRPEVNVTARIEAGVSDHGGVAAVSADVAGIGNLSMAFDPASGAYVVSRPLAPVGVLAFTVWAVDRAGLAGFRSGSAEVVDTTPPAILHAPPGPTPPDGVLVLSATITDNDWVAAANVTYVDDAGNPAEAPMRRTAGDAFEAAIPSGRCERTLEYRITARDGAGNAATSPFSAEVAGTPLFPCLYGDLTGWGLSRTARTAPGPTLTYDLGDPVTIRIAGTDDAPHVWYVDYNGNGRRDPDEPQSAQVLGNVTTLAFPADRAGTFTYYCAYHPGTMYGSFVVRAPDAGGPPATFPWEWIAAAILAAVAFAAIAFLLRRRRKGPAKDDSRDPTSEP